MTGYCPDCGNTLCICAMVAADTNAMRTTKGRLVWISKEARDDWQTLADLMDEEGFNPRMSDRLRASVAAWDALGMPGARDCEPPHA